MSNLAMMMGTVSNPLPAPAYTLGLTASLDSVSGNNAVWEQRTIDISAYATATVRLVFYYVSGTSYTGDIQLDAINIDGNFHSFETGYDNYETSTNESSTYAGVTWTNSLQTAASPKFARDYAGTPSSGTGLTSAADGIWYLFAETSSSGSPNTPFWLKSPEVTLGSAPTLTYYNARYGATIGTLNVYLDVIS